jgi:uncharacterized integral membrane protein
MNKGKAKVKTKKGLNLTVILATLLILIGLLLLAFNLGWLNPALKSVIFSWPMLLILLADVTVVSWPIFPAAACRECVSRNIGRSGW